MEACKEKNPSAFLLEVPKSLKWQFQNSLAAMTVSLSFLTQLEQTQFQAVNKWWHERGTERI
jgi:hypothetical protein